MGWTNPTPWDQERGDVNVLVKKLREQTLAPDEYGHAASVVLKLSERMHEYREALMRMGELVRQQVSK